MKRKKRMDKMNINTYFSLLGAAVLSMALTACGSGTISTGADIDDDTDIPVYETGHSSMPQLGRYLVEYESKYPYICADIVVSGYSAQKPEDDYFNKHVILKGEADITWQLYDSLPKLEEGVQARREGVSEDTGDAGAEADEAADGAGAEVDEAADDAEAEVDETADGAEVPADAGLTFRLLYYRFPLPEGTHALDIYETLKTRYDQEDHPLCVSSDGSGTIYTFSQEIYEGDYIAYIDTAGADINLTVKDGIAYGLILMGPEEMKSDESIRTLFAVYNDQIDDAHFGWVLDEEDLYWIDHEERTTVLEDGSSFLEVRGTDWGDDDRGFLSYFGMLKDADYEVIIAEGEKPLSVHFALDVEYSLKGELTTWLLNGSCVDERYNMTVTDPESGERLQALWVDLCVETIDTVTFTDLNADGCLDIQIDKPTHWNGIGAVMDEFASHAYLLWNPVERIFERKSADEVRNSLLANMNGLTEEEQDEKTKQERPDLFTPITELPDGADPDDYIELTGEGMEYVVQPGDCLWSISERLLGSGYDWPSIRRAEDAPKDPNYLLPGEIVTVPQRLYIPKDPYSRGGLSSKGSFQIEQPDGFEYMILAEDAEYQSWAKDNVIYYLPITNEMGENALSQDWEAFREEVVRCSDEICPGKVSNLQFEKYEVKGGCDLYGYSFEYDAGDKIIEYTVFIRLGAANMAEVIGIREKEPNTVLLNTTRYIAASFIDYGGKPGMTYEKSGPNVGAQDWDYPQLHNMIVSAWQQFE